MCFKNFLIWKNYRFTESIKNNTERFMDPSPSFPNGYILHKL